MALSAVHRQLDSVAVGTFEGLVTVEDRLDMVGAGRDISQAFDRVSKDRRVDDGPLPRGKALDIDTKDLDGPDARSRLEAGLVAFVG